MHWLFFLQMEKGDHFDAQKIAGNCDVSKLQIILLFKANLISSTSLFVKK